MATQIHPFDTLKHISHCHSHEQFLHIPESEIFQCIKEYFHECHLEDNNLNIKDINFYTSFKKLAESYINFIAFFKPMNRNEHLLGNGAQFVQKTEEVDLQCRKNTRSTFAMRNFKNQQELKKDQIFVRLLPRTHNCIHFMVKNHNFPRIQCRLSCNQHLEYLVNYLTSKWLSGKVGVGYQIKLFPDPSTYMHKHSNETKRPNFIHEPLNNYLMFTDIMAAFGVAQNGCINLLYDITEMRKQKEKQKVLHEKQADIHDNRSLKPSKLAQLQIHLSSKQQTPLSNKKEVLQQKSQQKANKKQLKLQMNIKQQILMDSNRDQHSMEQVKDNKNYINHNSVHYSQVNSIGYHFHNFNSNNIINTIFNINNSNTFLNGINGLETQKNFVENNHNSLLQNEVKFGKSSPNSKNPIIVPAAPENKLESIRNYISIVQKQAGGPHNEVAQELNEREQNSIHKSESNFKKEVKTVTIIKKKNQNE